MIERHNRFFSKALLFSLVLVVLVSVTAFPALAGERLKLSTTTSTDNTGLLDFMFTAFEKASGIKVEAIAVGTGKALKLAQNGDVDVTLVHAPSQEIKFVEDGHGVNRRVVMANYFIIVGPAGDPAKVGSAPDAATAFKLIAEGKYSFISRGDDSGTHTKERNIWSSAGIGTEGAWYIESGQGMGQTLTMADEKMGYTLCDEGTYMKFEPKVELKALYVKKDSLLYNPYAVMAVNPARWQKINYDGAMKFIVWITSPEAQKLIGNFKDKKGRAFFTPLAVPAAQ